VPPKDNLIGVERNLQHEDIRATFPYNLNKRAHLSSGGYGSRESREESERTLKIRGSPARDREIKDDLCKRRKETMGRCFGSTKVVVGMQGSDERDVGRIAVSCGHYGNDRTRHNSI